MIDFRYHIDSIVAIFMALAVGIVLGSGPLKDDISGFLEDRTQQLADEKVELQSEVSTLRAEIESSEQFAELSQAVLVDGLLTSRVTAIVVLPNVDGGQVDAVEDAVTAAGGAVGERITLESAWTDPEQSEILGRVAETIARGGRDADPYELASQVLAEALLTPGGRAVGESSFDSIAVLAAFENEGFISADEDEVIRGDTAIVVGPAGVVLNADLTVVPLTLALDDVGAGTVLAAPRGSDQSAGVNGVLRGSNADGVVSSEDRLDTGNGVTVTILALAEQIAGGVGHYGSGEGSDGPAPDPLPRG
ncbi:MAG: copper transporter [Actinomycetia bacterium]|nr:copper transporter [Actinomycetes bacterium]